MPAAAVAAFCIVDIAAAAAAAAEEENRPKADAGVRACEAKNGNAPAGLTSMSAAICAVAAAVDAAPLAVGTETAPFASPLEPLPLPLSPEVERRGDSGRITLAPAPAERYTTDGDRPSDCRGEVPAADDAIAEEADEEEESEAGAATVCAGEIEPCRGADAAES